MGNFSATGGADSGPQSIAETPTEEKDSQFGNGKYHPLPVLIFSLFPIW